MWLEKKPQQEQVLLLLPERQSVSLLKEVPREDLAIGMKGASDAMKERIFSNLADEADAGKLKDEMTFSGPVRMSDVEEVQLRTVKVARELERAGKITIVRGDSEDKFV